MSKTPHYSWKPLFTQLVKNTFALIESHNLQYPTKIEIILNKLGGTTIPFALSYPGRVKAGEENTICNILRQYAKQVADQVNQGQMVINNKVSTNRAKARKGKSIRVANRHIAKGVLVGIFQGRPLEKGDPKEYLFGELDDGGKIGAVPYKHFHGHERDFELLIDPRIIPVGVLPPGVKLVAFEDFYSEPQAVLPTIYMRRKSHHIQAKTETINKTIRQKASSLRSEKLTEDVSEEGNREGVSGFSEGMQKNLQHRWPADIQAPADPSAQDPKVASVSKTTGASCNQVRPADTQAKACSGVAGRSTLPAGTFHSLYLAGAVLEAFARLLIDSYIKKLAAAMGKTIHPNEQQAGYQSALRLLSRFSPDQLDTETDRYILTIDHMEQWIRYKGGFVALPGKWFDPDYAHGIEGAYKRFVIPWQETGRKFREDGAGENPGDQDDPNQVQAEKALARQNTWYNLAFQFKQGFMALHQTDSRLKGANLHAWADEFRKLVKRDKRNLSEVVKVANWLFDHDSSRAKFWRKETGGFGLRSVSGFRRNYARMREQMAQDYAKHR